MKSLPDKNRKEWQALLREDYDLPFQNYFFKTKVIQLREQVAGQNMSLTDAVEELHALCGNMFEAAFLQDDLALIFDDFKADTFLSATENVDNKPVIEENPEFVENENAQLAEDLNNKLVITNASDEAKTEVDNSDKILLASEEKIAETKQIQQETVSDVELDDVSEKMLQEKTDIQETEENTDFLEKERKKAQELIEKRLKEIEQNKNKKFVPKTRSQISSDTAVGEQNEEKKTNKTKPKKSLRKSSRKKKKGFWDNLFG